MSNTLLKEELTELLKIKEEYSTVIYALGEITTKIEQIELDLSEMNDLKRNYLQTHKTISDRDKNLAQILSDKYGSGVINLETGEITRS